MSKPDTNTGNRKWLIISWQHNDTMDGAYGRLLETFEGTPHEAIEAAKFFVPNYSPVGIVQEIV